MHQRCASGASFKAPRGACFAKGLSTKSHHCTSLGLKSAAVLRAEGESGLRERGPPSPQLKEEPFPGSQTPNPPLPGTPPKEDREGVGQDRGPSTQRHRPSSAPAHEAADSAPLHPPGITPTAEKRPTCGTSPSTSQLRVSGECRPPGQEKDVLTLSNSSTAGRGLSPSRPTSHTATRAPAAARTSSQGSRGRALWLGHAGQGRPGLLFLPVTSKAPSLVWGVGGGGRAGGPCLVQEFQVVP